MRPVHPVPRRTGRLGLLRAAPARRDLRCLRRRCDGGADRLAERGLPQTVEWVHETTPTLLDAVRAAGSFELEELPLLALDGDLAVTAPALPDGVTVRLLGPVDVDALAAATAVCARGVHCRGHRPWGRRTCRAGRGGQAGPSARRRPGGRGRRSIAVAEHAANWGRCPTGRTLPVDGVTEVMGVADPAGGACGRGSVPPSRPPWSTTRVASACARCSSTASSPDVARVYEGIGFRRVGTGWAAERR